MYSSTSSGHQPDPLSPSRQTNHWSPTSPNTHDRNISNSGLPSSSSGGASGWNDPSSTTSPIREPQIHGAPGLGLLSPPAAPDGDDDASGEPPTPFLRVRIGSLDRNRKDLLIRFDASTNLPNFRRTLYKNMQRSYVEFQKFAEQAQLTSPQTIIPALPLASTSAISDEEDDRLVKVALQRWFSRVCEDEILQKDDELRSFVESDFGYSPIPPPTAKRSVSASSAVPSVLSAALSKVVRRGPLDEDDDLQMAKGALERLEERWGGSAAAIGTLGKARRAHATASQDVGSKLISLSTVESDIHLQTAERKVGRTLEQLSGMYNAQASAENVVLSDSLGYQALNARAAKDALLQRTQLLEDSQTASKAAINKRRNVERLKGSSNINPMKVDDAITEMDEANNLEDSLTKRLNAISVNLHNALRNHSRQTHDDVAVALLENARLTLGYHRHLLRELEALRPDLAKVGATANSSLPVPYETPEPVIQNKASLPSNNPPLGIPPSTSQPSMTTSRPYQQSSSAGPPSGSRVDTSKSMFLPPPPAQSSSSSSSSAPAPRRADPLAGQMAQSVILPASHAGQQQQQQQTSPWNNGKRLDARQAAKWLSGGF